MREEEIFDRYGRRVLVTRIPPRGKAKSLFKNNKPYDGSTSPFERFEGTNSTKSKHTSY